MLSHSNKSNFIFMRHMLKRCTLSIIILLTHPPFYAKLEDTVILK
uniref:Uncharacterized protein n=1 Tax=Anguilla anguilla TaxID=7936 RepID=A0A0E9UI50_ANGAN